jgi:hypothetical protein
MILRALLVGTIVLLPIPVFGQTTPATPTFEIADVRVSDRQMNVGVTGNAIRDGRYELHNATMVDLIRIAYGIEAEKVAGGPNWLELDRYTMIAKAPAPTPAADARLMLRTVARLRRRNRTARCRCPRRSTGNWD